jgi:general secretion pathway protein G
MKQHYKKQGFTKQGSFIKGFTLIEIMVVIMILGILAALIVPKVLERPAQAKIAKAKQDLQSIQSALEMYYVDNGIYPTQEQGLMALVKQPTISPLPNEWKDGGYLKKLPKDPFGGQYIYQNPAKNANPDVNCEVQVISLGADQKVGGQGNDEDILSCEAGE